LGSLVRLDVWATQVLARIESYPFGEQKGGLD